MGRPVLMFGIGATKAGTSWLYRYLDAHPDCAMPVAKELHYFDSLENGTDACKLADDRIQTARAALKDAQRGERAKALRGNIAAFQEWRALLANPQDNARDYLQFLHREADGAKLVGDITPSYALLSEARLKMMAGLAETVKFVYLLRDPVSRLWSNLRMMAARQAKNATQVAEAARRLVDRVLSGDEHSAMRRSDYADTLARLDRAVAPGALFVGFYETLFSAQTLERLCGFLGIAPKKGQLQKRVHGGTSLPLDETLQVALARHLAPQYAAVEARYGALPEAWRKNMAKVR